MTRKGRKPSRPAGASLEPVLEFRATGTQLVFRVASGGCTEAKHFKVGVERRNGEAKVTLTRLVTDNCKGDFPDGAEIKLSYKSAGLDRTDVIKLVNPIR